MIHKYNCTACGKGTNIDDHACNCGNEELFVNEDYKSYSVEGFEEDFKKQWDESCRRTDKQKNCSHRPVPFNWGVYQDVYRCCLCELIKNTRKEFDK